LGFLALAGVASLLWAVPPAGAASRPLLTAVTDDPSYEGPDAPLALQRTRQAGATFARVGVTWSRVVPKGSAKPSGFDPSNPADPAYNWSKLDREIQLVVASGLQPILGFHGAPRWAEDQSPHPTMYSGYRAGPYKPSPVEVGAFAHALAVRYSGHFQGLPRVRYWRLWNESNLIGYLSPQFENGKPFAPGWYRLMLAAFAKAVHGVHADNLVIAGSLAPFTLDTAAMGPLEFLRSLLCLSAGKRPKPVCKARASFDALAVHPYTFGGPTRHAANPNDVSIADLPEVRRLLDAGVRYHRIVSRSRPQLWVTEFSWDTQPPDPNPLAAPLSLQSRWTAEALYRMWQHGVRVVTWFLLRDLPWPDSEFQSGLYFRSGVGLSSDLAKPTLTAFRFPFVAYRRPGKTFVWGRTPGGRRARVVVEQRRGKGGKPLATLKSDRFGIFSKLLHKIADPPAPPQLSVLTTYSSAVLADSPSDYWRLGESGGPSTADLTGAHDGVASGGVSFGPQGALENDGNTAVCLNGTDGKIGLGPISSPGSIEFWVKTDSQQDAPVFSNRSPSNGYLVAGTFLQLAHVFDSFGLIGERRVGDDQWHQVVYTYEGVTGKVYVDGTLQGEDTWPRTAGESDASLGFDAALGTYFQGCIDEVSLYGGALPAERVQAHYLASGRKLAADPDLGTLRARVGPEDASLPFSLTPPKDRYVLPFGG